jgi:hypothetical protein
MARDIKQGSDNHELIKLMKDGLGQNPTIESVHAWVSHARQNMIHGQKKIPITREMVELVAKSEILYTPLWNTVAQIVMGSFARVKSPIPTKQYSTGETLRQDVAALLSACIQLYTLSAVRKNALIALPVRASTLNDTDVSEFYLSVIQCISPDIRKSLILEVKNVPKSQAATKLSARLEEMAEFIRGYMFDTSMFTYFDYTKAFPKLHACGFDLAEGDMTPEEKIKIIKKYSEAYKKMNIKYYVKGVSSRDILESCIQEGFTYVSGTIIEPFGKVCWPVMKLTLNEIGLHT